MIKVAILDDYQNVSEKFVDLKKLSGKYEFKIFSEPFIDEADTIEKLAELKDKGTVYGCNAIYRDYPEICDYIVAVNPPMYEEILEWYNSVKYRSARSKPNLKIIGPEDVSKWNYIMPGDSINDVPQGLKLYRIWRGGDYRKPNVIRTIDFSNSRGSGCSAVLHAAEAGFKNIIIMAFDIIGAQQWEPGMTGEVSRIQNNIYKNTQNYPSRISMKAYLKFEWMYHLRQTFRRYPKTNFSNPLKQIYYKYITI